MDIDLLSAALGVVANAVVVVLVIRCIAARHIAETKAASIADSLSRMEPRALRLQAHARGLATFADRFDDPRKRLDVTTAAELPDALARLCVIVTVFRRIASWRPALAGPSEQLS